MKNSKKETQMSDLKPCPFCGTSNEKHNNIVKLYDDEYYAYEYCNACGARVYANWNNRPIEDALQARIDELEKQVEWHPFDINNINTYPPRADMYLTLSIPERTEYRGIDYEETYNVLWFELYSEEYWHKRNVTYWAYIPAPPQEEECQAK